MDEPPREGGSFHFRAFGRRCTCHSSGRLRAVGFPCQNWQVGRTSGRWPEFSQVNRRSFFVGFADPSATDARLGDNGPMALLTVGHGSLDREGLAALLKGAEIDLLVDVRRFPGSRRNPDVKSEALAQWLPEEGIAYRWEPELGGRRRLPKDEESPDGWWRVEAFRAYAAYTRTDEFREALTGVVEEAAQQRTVVLCSESVWWRCHRRLIADVATLVHDLPVHHLMHDGKERLHVPSEGARRDDGVLVWDGG
jgi:hypothetical protein